ncbi:hypothetical protein SETIT_4G249200v2 [Setaria italica]|uniref:Uncharacterized protein n=1 Tax=Setaria italica TaxID=4555 RepID=A0A368QXX6_SETIT|nr:hypothetical protein SETIT_4G249200v2 [Setaria italica]
MKQAKRRDACRQTVSTDNPHNPCAFCGMNVRENIHRSTG